MGDIVVVVN